MLIGGSSIRTELVFDGRTNELNGKKYRFSQDVKRANKLVFAHFSCLLGDESSQRRRCLLFK
jgi:hypothetical protein